MGKKVLKNNFRVVVEPYLPSGWAYRSSADGIERRNKDCLRYCEDVISQIKRHVDDVQNVYVEYDNDPVCEHCGSVWSEESDVYNGGCCSKDEEMNGESSGEDC